MWRRSAPALIRAVSAPPSAVPAFYAKPALENEGQSTGYNFTGSDIKQSADDRYLAMFIHHQGGSSPIDALSVDGVPAVSGGFSDGSTKDIEFWMAPLTSANPATGTIAVNFVATKDSCLVMPFVVENLTSATLFDTEKGALTGTTNSRAINVAEDGIILAAVRGIVDGRTWTWSGLTKTHEVPTIEAGTGSAVSAAAGIRPSAQTNYPFSATSDASVFQELIAVSLR